MLKEQMSKFKEMLKTQDGNNKRKIENLVVFIVILIISIIIINMIWNSDKENKEDATNIQNNTNKKIAQTEETSQQEESADLEKRLEEILKNISGVGNVKVLLTYSESSQTVAMYNEDSTKNDTEEKDTRRR